MKIGHAIARVTPLIMGMALLVVFGADSEASAQVMADAAMTSPESAATAGAEAMHVERLEARLAERIAATLGRPVADTRIEVTGAIPAATDSMDVVQGSRRWIITFFLDGARVRRFARSGQLGPVPVAARPIPRGTVLTDADIRMERRVAWDDEEGGPEAVDGYVAQRSIDPGERLAEPGVRPPYLVRGGQAVQAVLSHSGILMTLRGEALSAARLGDHVRVKLPSGVRMEGTVVGPGQVALNGGGR